MPAQERSFQRAWASFVVAGRRCLVSSESRVVSSRSRRLERGRNRASGDGPRLASGTCGGWGWFYLSTILDDFSRYIIAWKPCTTMRADDVTDTLQLALTTSGCASARVVHKPRLLSDNGSSYISGDLAKWLEDAGMDHVRGAPCHPQTQGKIERCHQTLKNRILLENYYLPGDLEANIDRFVDHDNHRRYHEGLQNLTPADVYFGRGHTIRIKRDTIKHRRLQHQPKAA